MNSVIALFYAGISVTYSQYPVFPPSEGNLTAAEISSPLLRV